jgi:hypothetical protein
MITSPTAANVVRIGVKEFNYRRVWDGQPLTAAGYLAFDTETEVMTQNWDVPRLALASACAGGSAACLVHPDQVGAFILAHPRARYVFFNVAFDFWVVDRHLSSRGEVAARRLWWAACDESRMCDAMLLDMLIELARSGAETKRRDLAAVGRQYARLEISKDDPYRLRYGEIIGRDWDELEEGFFAYAIKDAIVTFHAYRKMTLEANRLMAEFIKGSEKISDDAVPRFGLLSEYVQVKGAVALAQVSRNGMSLDFHAVQAAEAELRARLDGATTALRDTVPELFKTRTDHATGQSVLCLTEKGATPSKNAKVLQDQLVRAIDDIRRDTGEAPDIPRTTNTGALSTSAKVWAPYATMNPFVERWILLEDSSKLCQFFRQLREPVVHPSYRCLLRTGRTSCSEPNIQQIPREGMFRQAFVPSKGHLLLAVDYSFIELVTLAAVCLKRYGQSVLADVIKAGRDPHAYTAAMFFGVPPEDFASWKDCGEFVQGPLAAGRAGVTRGKLFKDWRQAAKAVNFGTPGGLAPTGLVDYAKNTFKVTMTLEEAAAFRAKLTGEVYPELDRYLAEDAMTILAGSLKASVWSLWNQFDWKGNREPAIAGGIRNVVRGRTTKANGELYHPRYYAGVWDGLIRLCEDSDLKPLLAQRQGSEELHDRLFGGGVATLTGRIRGGVTFCQARNTPFQGLAADGAKLALWRLVAEGYRVVGFVHDEILVELPDEGGFVSEAKVARVKEIMCRAMEEVLVGEVPVNCEATVSTCWSKDAKLIVRDGRVIPWEPDKAPGDNAYVARAA